MTSDHGRAQTILERLEAGEVLVSDGATGTYLQQHGLEPGGCPEEFNASHPDVVRGMAKDYFDAGSDMVLTNSFGGSRYMQKKYGYEGRVQEFNRLAAEHAASQKPDGLHYVAASVGPTGEMMEPLPDGVSESEVYDALRRADDRPRRRRRRRDPGRDADGAGGGRHGHPGGKREHRPASPSQLWCSTSGLEASSR